MIRRVVLIGMVLLMLCLYIQPGFAGLSNTDVVKNITDQSVAGKSPGNSTVQDILITVTPTVRPASVLTPTQELSPSIPLSKNQTAATQGTPGSSCSSCEFIEKYPLMHFTPAQLSAEQAQFDAAPKYSAPLHVLTRNGNLPMGSKSLLSYLPYTPSERAQGVCGNCWVWASTGALEIDHAVKTGIKDRLSIQYLNSKFNDGVGSSWACCGGTLSTFTEWYNTDTHPIPWSNTNASYGDASSRCNYYTTAVPLSTIATRPNYTIDSISYSTISTYGVGQSTAINNIKSALNENKAIYYSFNYNDTGWNAFNDFWGYSKETSVFDPKPYDGGITTGGHGVLLVGYDDTDPSNQYWIVVNSWGASSNRSQGLFRQTMNMNYDAVYYSSDNGVIYGPYQQHKFQILNSTFTSRNTTVGIFRSGTFYLNGQTNPIAFGLPTDTPIVGSWAGTGIDTVGVWRAGTFYFNGLPPTQFGSPTDTPLVGHWTAGASDTPGVWRAGTFYFNGLSPIQFGSPTDTPLVGDWTGSGVDTPGVFRSGTFYLNGQTNPIAFGLPTDTPLVWRTSSGADSVGVWRAGTFYFYGGSTTQFGLPTDTPLVGKWA